MAPTSEKKRKRKTPGQADGSQERRPPDPERVTEMPKNVYEFMFILDPRQVSTEMPAAWRSCTRSSRSTSARSWPAARWSEQQRLAYPIRNQKRFVFI